MAIQTRPPTPLPTHNSLSKPADKKRKRDKKGKEVSKEGEVVPIKELEPQKGEKITKGAQRKTSAEGMVAERVFERRPRVPIWNPPLELDGAPLLPDSFIRDFQKKKKSWLCG